MGKAIGFIGAGLIGKPMAGNLLKKGFTLTTIINRNPHPIRELEQKGAYVASSYGELAQRSNVVILMLPGPAQIEKVLFESDLLENLREGSIIIDMSTSNPHYTQQVARRVEDYRLQILDAPVTRGIAAAEAGELLLMVGGEKEVLEDVQEILEAMASKIIYVGGHGAGHSAKLINNLKIMAEMSIISEGLALGLKAGIKPEILYEILQNGSADSFYLRYKVPRMLSGDFVPGATMHTGYKDLRLATEWADQLGVPIPLVNLSKQVYLQAIQAGLGEEDTAALIKLYENLLQVSMRSEKYQH